MNKAAWIVLGIIIGFITCLCVNMALNEAFYTWPITDKYQEGDSHYLLVEVEVTAEEYIGYDVGDDYEISITQ